jgi:hypothetical protein
MVTSLASRGCQFERYVLEAFARICISFDASILLGCAISKKKVAAAAGGCILQMGIDGVKSFSNHSVELQIN